MNPIAALLLLVQMNLCGPVAGVDPDTGQKFHAVVCPIPEGLYDAIVEATTEPS